MRVGNIEIKGTAFSTFPNKKEAFWQLVVVPTITIVRCVERKNKYTAVSFEWLFWSGTIIISNDKRRVHSTEEYEFLSNSL